MTDVHELVRERYAKSALAVLDASSDCCAPGDGADLYSILEREELP